MTIARALAEIAFAAADSPPEDLLRSYLLADLVAAAGAPRDNPLLAAAFAAIGSGSPGSHAYRLACRAHFRTQDDFDADGRTHVGAVVIPAVLALGSESVLAPMAAGYAVLTCVSRAYRDEAERRGFRPTGVFGPIGAAAAAGVALGLDADRLAAALSLSSAMCAGTNRSWIDGSDEWMLEVGAASRAGVEAALLANGGVNGATAAFEGRAGWAVAYFDDSEATALTRQLEETDRHLERVAMKPYPVSGIAQVPTALAAELGRRLGHRNPDRVEIRMAPSELAYPGSTNLGPFSSRSASLMSVARCAALSYVQSVVPLRTLASPVGDEGAVLDVLELVSAEEIPEGSAEIRVSLDGRVERASGNCSELLHPSWSSLVDDIEGLAGRCEVPAWVALRLKDAVAAEATTGSLLAALDGERPPEAGGLN